MLLKQNLLNTPRVIVRFRVNTQREVNSETLELLFHGEKNKKVAKIFDEESGVR